MSTLPHVTIIGVYRSPRVPVRQICASLMAVLTLHCSDFDIFIGDFNVNWLNEKEKIPLYNLFIKDHSYKQLVSCYTTDNRTTIDHTVYHTVFTLIYRKINSIYTFYNHFSDHKAICALIQT